MRKLIYAVAAVVGLGLAGCVAVPYDPYPYSGGVVVQPSVSFGYSGHYHGGYRHGGRGHRGHHGHHGF